MTLEGSLLVLGMQWSTEPHFSNACMLTILLVRSTDLQTNHLECPPQYQARRGRGHSCFFPEYSPVRGLPQLPSRGQCKSLRLVTTMQESEFVPPFPFLFCFCTIQVCKSLFCINSNVNDLPVYLLHNAWFKVVSVRLALVLLKIKSAVGEM